MELSIREQLHEIGLKATPSRIAVLETLHVAAEPMDVQAILGSFSRASAPDQATVYRILNSLVEAEIVREVYVIKGVSSYEIADRPHHHHLICEKCGFVEDVKNCCDNPKPVNTSFKKITHHNLEFMGICENCA